MYAAAGTGVQAAETTTAPPSDDAPQTTQLGEVHVQAATLSATSPKLTASLLDTPVAKADEPLEILRTLHSFDPCMACSTHVLSPDGQEMASIKVR